MSVVSVIRAAMALKGVSRAGLAPAFGCSSGAMGTKFARGSFSADDLVRVAEALGYKLALVDEAGSVVLAFNMEGIAPPRRSGGRSAVSTAEGDQAAAAVDKP